MQNEERIRGVFSTQEVRKVGTGTTTRKTVVKTFWYIDHDEATNELSMQSLNSNYIPMGAKKPVTREELIARFEPEPEFYTSTVYPKIKEVNDSVNAADAHREKGENFSAEFEYENALKLDEENVRANFGIGLTYLAQGDKEKADNILGRIANLEASFAPEHKHLYNEFGINLRKSKMYDRAIDYYKRAIEMGNEDENLHLNIARVYLEMTQYDDCLKEIQSALVFDMNNAVAQKMLDWLCSKEIIKQEDINTVKEEAVLAQSKKAEEQE